MDGERPASESRNAVERERLRISIRCARGFFLLPQEAGLSRLSGLTATSLRRSWSPRRDMRQHVRTALPVAAPRAV
jgi:hypothetical protein